MKFDVPLMMPAIHSMLFAVRPSRSALMIGMPPATDASNPTITPLACAAAKMSVPWLRQQRLVRGDDVLAVGDRVEHQRARRIDPADELAHDVDVRMPDDDRRVVRQVHASDSARSFARAVERTRGDPVDRDRPAGAALDLLLVAAQDVPRPLADGAEPEEADVDGLHAALTPRPAVDTRRGTSRSGRSPRPDRRRSAGTPDGSDPVQSS